MGPNLSLRCQAVPKYATPVFHKHTKSARSLSHFKYTVFRTKITASLNLCCSHIANNTFETMSSWECRDISGSTGDRIHESWSWVSDCLCLFLLILPGAFVPQEPRRFCGYIGNTVGAAVCAGPERSSRAGKQNHGEKLLELIR